jgi:tetratricopeptide (TPR) repeat protein
MNKYFLFFLIILISSFSIQSCSSCNKRHKKDERDSVFAKGKITENVKCRKDATQSYSLYLPSNYSEDKKWPVVYAFDSHGKGLLPVELFKDEAEKYGYIIVGSNNSKNGTPWETTSAIYDTLYSDTHHRFSIDNSRIYTAGFSGGSRVASTIAITKGGINSVIGCGAGFGSQEQPTQKFSYFGVAGNFDMNLNEMIALDSALERSGFRHYLHTFDGKHEWPPKTVVSDAFLWLELNAMKDKLKPVNDILVKNTFDNWEKKYDSLTAKANSYDAYLLCKKIINYFDGLIDISKVKTELSKLESLPAITQAKKHLNDIGKQESELQTYYSNAISSQTADWWKSQVAMINQKINSTQDNEEKYMYKRLLNYLSLADYMNISNAMKTRQFEQAEKFNIIYALVDPDNPEHEYISATLSMKKGKPQEAIAYLEKAAELGFAEPDRLESDTVMNSLKQDAKYSGILETIKNNTKKKQ